MATTASWLSTGSSPPVRHGRYPATTGLSGSPDYDYPVASSPLLPRTSTQSRIIPYATVQSRKPSTLSGPDLAHRRSMSASVEGTSYEEDLGDDNSDDGQADRRHPNDDQYPSNAEDVDEVGMYSTDQLDSILRAARDQLTQLEGKVKGARHSLADMPSLASYSPTSSSSSPIRTTHHKTSSEDSTRLTRSPRINFGAPRTNSTFSTARERNIAKHGRNFSDTSVPSPHGQVPKGSLHAAFTSRRRRPLSGLYPVAEETSSTNQLTEIRKEADNVRKRLSFIEAGVKRSSWRGISSTSQPENDDRMKEIYSLEKLLKRQEDYLRDLERPDEPAVAAEKYGEGNFLDLSNEDDRYSEGDSGYKSVTGEPFEGLEHDFEGSHENRPDAFDYEHFIIHSLLNSTNGQDSRPRSSSSLSTDSVSTPRGPSRAVNDTERGFEEEPSRDVDELQHVNQSVTSFATARSFIDTSDSDSDHEEQTSDEERELLDNSESWPTPPASSNARKAPAAFESIGASLPSPSSARLPTGPRGSTARARAGGRPASVVFSAVLDPLAGGAVMSEEDETLIRSLAESMRHACRELQRNHIDMARGDFWRSRLEEARKLLSGETEMF